MIKWLALLIFIPLPIHPSTFHMDMYRCNSERIKDDVKIIALLNKYYSSKDNYFSVVKKKDETLFILVVKNNYVNFLTNHYNDASLDVCAQEAFGLLSVIEIIEELNNLLKPEFFSFTDPLILT